MNMEASEYAVDEANAERLTTWLNAGQWTRKEATLLFLEIDPDRESGDIFSTFSGHGEVQYEYFDDDDPSSRMEYGVDEDGKPDYLTSEQDALLHKTKKLFRQIERRLNLYDLAEPHEWIEFGCKRGIPIPWLDWAIERGLYIQKQESGAISIQPVVGGSESEPIPRHLLATPAQLIAAFGVFTGMNKAWFNKLSDKPQLLAAKHKAGESGRGGTAPLFYVFPVMQWLIDPKRKAGKTDQTMLESTGWRMLQAHFPEVYDQYEAHAPDPD